MRSNVATLCARAGIATLVSLGVFTVPATAVSAAPGQQIAVVHDVFAASPTPAECSAIQAEIEGLKAEIRYLQEYLHEATPAQKPDIIRMIRELYAEIRELRAQLEGCPA
jgi:hypothetical protein